MALGLLHQLLFFIGGLLIECLVQTIDGRISGARQCLPAPGKTGYDAIHSADIGGTACVCAHVDVANFVNVLTVIANDMLKTVLYSSYLTMARRGMEGVW